MDKYYEQKKAWREKKRKEDPDYNKRMSKKWRETSPFAKLSAKRSQEKLKKQFPNYKKEYYKNNKDKYTELNTQQMIEMSGVDVTLGWKKLKSHAYKDYIISECGKIYSFIINDYIIPKPNRSGYYYVVITQRNGVKNKHLIHHLISDTFKRKVLKTTYIEFKDGNRSNYHLSNLNRYSPLDRLKKAEWLKVYNEDPNNFNIRFWYWEQTIRLFQK